MSRSHAIATALIKQPNGTSTLSRTRRRITFGSVVVGVADAVVGNHDDGDGVDEGNGNDDDDDDDDGSISGAVIEKRKATLIGCPVPSDCPPLAEVANH